MTASFFVFGHFALVILSLWILSFKVLNPVGIFVGLFQAAVTLVAIYDL